MDHLPAPPIPSWIEEQLPENTRRYLLDVGGLNMHIMEIGEGYPILMQHGNPTWGYLYRKVVNNLSGQKFRIILPDLIGFGFSDKPSSYRSHLLENHIQWLANALEQMGLKELIFVGQDWGGPIGVGAISQTPEIVKGMVILNTVLGPPKPNFKPTAFHRFANMPVLSDIAFRVFGYPQVALHKAQGDPASISGIVAKSYRFPLRGIKNNVAALGTARMVPNSLDHPSVAPLGRVASFVESFEGPAEIVWGKKDPVLGRLLKRTIKALPNAAVTETGAGHFLQEEVPEEIAQAVINIFEKISK